MDIAFDVSERAPEIDFSAGNRGIAWIANLSLESRCVGRLRT